MSYKFYAQCLKLPLLNINVCFEISFLMKSSILLYSDNLVHIKYMYIHLYIEREVDVYQDISSDVTKSYHLAHRLKFLVSDDSITLGK